jgi:DNA-binding YbaB/EbfC family protein
MFSKIKAIKNLRDQAKQMQNTLEQVTAEGSAGWGKVKIKMNGNQKVLSLEIADELLADKKKLTETIIEAFADATKNLQKEMAGRMKEMGGVQEMMKNLGM